MEYNSQQRQRNLIGKPLWADSQVVLPLVDIYPLPQENDLEDQRWNVCIMNGGNGQWYEVELTLDEMSLFFWEWNRNPEATFCNFFGEEGELPKGLGCTGDRVSKSTDDSPEDLGF